MQSGHYLPRSLPDSLQGLAVLALDLRWSWHHGSDKLWRKVDAELWEATGNPWLILESISDHRLDELAADAQFLSTIEQCLAEREEHCAAATWFQTLAPALSGNIAYFSMEFGLSESLPIYSGGLGVLAGDTLKTACDLDVPLVGVGLLYQQGYFRQALDSDGGQLEFYPVNDPTMLPVSPLRDDGGEWIHIHLELPGRLLRLRTWHARIGRRTLLLLDSNDLLNSPGDRGITSELYGGGTEMRLQQEMVLGIGGWRLLQRLGLDCPVCHLNEGHAAFAIFERARHYMEVNGASFPVALRATRAGNLFTTHTPVAAGFDRFPAELFGQYFRDYADRSGIELERLLALGRSDPRNDDEPFNMAYLAVNGAAAINGVSRLHGRVSRHIFQPLFPRWPTTEVPIGYITNGVHVPSWDSPVADTLWTGACGKSRWRGALETVARDLCQVGDVELWQFRCQGRLRLIEYLRRCYVRQHAGRGISSEQAGQAISALDPDVMTLGMARRFAEYKRPDLILHDPERLARLLTNRDQPVQLVIAGKAHPKDAAGRQLLKNWHEFLNREDVRGHAVFVEDYDLGVAEQMVQGVDVWINTPRRPWEASGTSGMKVLANGGLNLSELDGWWAEAYHPGVGWALGDGREHSDTTAWDRHEADQLYQLLEQQVVPAFYQRDQRGLPVQWIERMRESMAHLTTQYSSNRMLRDYVEKYYLPLAASYARRTREVAEEIEDWFQALCNHWSHLHFGSVTSIHDQARYHFEVQVYLDELSPELVEVQLYADPLDGGDPVTLPLERGESLLGTGHGYIFQGSVPDDRPLSDYTPRIVPRHPEASVPLEADFILWHH